MIIQTKKSILTALMRLDGGGKSPHLSNIVGDIIIAREQARQLDLADYVINDRSQLPHHTHNHTTPKAHI